MKRRLIYGLGVWLIPFIVAMLVFPFRGSERALFESIMALTLVKTVLALGSKYLGRVKKNVANEAVMAGWTWLLMCVGLDMLFFTWGPMKMSIRDYVYDIGVTYLTIPVIMYWLGKVKKG